MARELHPEAQAVLDQLEALHAPSIRTLSPAGARELQFAEVPEEDRDQVANTRDYRLAGPDGDLPVRVYWPEGEGPFPIVTWFHGGGFVIGDIEGSDPLCRAIANEAESIVVSVEYRLAPEHPFPAGLEDCYAATEWAAENADSLGGRPDQVAVGGTSAGANLAAAVALMARDHTESYATDDGPALAYQWLIYPAANTREEYPAYEENAEGFLLETADSRWFREHYFDSRVDRFHPYAYPLEARDLAGLPPATVVTAEFDPLRDDGRAYAERLDEADVPVTLRHYDGMIHGFFGMVQLSRARDAIEAVSGDFRDAL